MSRARDFGSVTVIIPTLGRPELLRALASVHAQSVTPERVLLVDDSPGGADQSLDRLGVDVVRTTGHCGAAAARNVGMSLSDTDFIAFLDDDDEWLPDHLLNALQAFHTDPELDVYGCAARVLTGGAERMQPAVPYRGGGLENHFYGRAVWRGRSRRIVTPGLVARRWVTSVRMDETLVSSEDTWWLLTLERQGAVIRQSPAVEVVVHAMGERTASRINDQSTVEWAARLNSHYPGRGADFLVGLARGRCRSGDPRGVIGTWRLRRRVDGFTLRHRLLTLAAVMVAGALSLAKPQGRLRR